MKPFLKKYLPVIQFLGVTGSLCALYYLWFSKDPWGIPVIGKYYGYFVHYTLLTLGESSVFLLNLLGYPSHIINDPNFEAMRFIDMDDSYPNVYIKNFCLGIDTMFVFSALILGYPGKWKDRLWFIPLGVVGIHVINILRITALCLALILFPNQHFVDHHTVFNILAMVFIFFMFVIWVKRNETLTNRN